MNLTMDQLNKIPWDTLEVSSGKGGHVPNALRGLVSPDDAVRNTSYWQLDNEVVCQSDLYESAYFVLPFLLAMLRERVQYGRDRIYDLLYEIANGYAPTTVLVRTPTGVEMSLMDACAQEISMGVDIFRRDASDENIVIVKKAKDMLDLLENNDD